MVTGKTALPLVLSGLLMLTGILVGGPARAQEDNVVTVLELFTSQGCSSCPPADALLSTLAKKNGVLALTMPVNYWDHLGWKDTLATETLTSRQRSYADHRGDHQIYTPQMIVNGLLHVVGSRRDAIEEAVLRTGRTIESGRVPIRVSSEGGDIVIRAGDAPEAGSYHSGTLWLVLFSRSVKVDIRRGENLGRKIVYTNVVRQLLPAGRWHGKAATLRFMPPAAAGTDGYAVFLQADRSNAIIGAAMASLKVK